VKEKDINNVNTDLEIIKYWKNIKKII
jgi:hypothetical protein